MKASGWQVDVIRRVLAVASKAAPTATTSIKWGQPVIEANGPFLFVRPAKAHVTVGFWRGRELADPNGLLEHGNMMGHWKVKSAEALDEKALAELVKSAVVLNQQKGDPSKR